MNQNQKYFNDPQREIVGVRVEENQRNTLQCLKQNRIFILILTQFDRNYTYIQNLLKNSCFKKNLK